MRGKMAKILQIKILEHLVKQAYNIRSFNRIFDTNLENLMDEWMRNIDKYSLTYPSRNMEHDNFFPVTVLDEEIKSFEENEAGNDAL